MLFPVGLPMTPCKSNWEKGLRSTISQKPGNWIYKCPKKHGIHRLKSCHFRYLDWSWLVAIQSQSIGLWCSLLVLIRVGVCLVSIWIHICLVPCRQWVQRTIKEILCFGDFMNILEKLVWNTVFRNVCCLCYIKELDPVWIRVVLIFWPCLENVLDRTRWLTSLAVKDHERY